VTEYDEITTQARGIVIGARRVSKYLHKDELIAEVTMEVPVAKVITRIKELHTKFYKGDRVSTTDIVDVKKHIKRDMIRATGSGVPPARFVGKARSAGVDMPDWLGRSISATGQGTDPNITTAQGKLKAARAAELDAKRKLAEQIYGLSISSDTTVRDSVTEHDEITTQVDAVLSRSIVGRYEIQGDMATVTVKVPAANVWEVVHQQILISERDG